MRVTSDIYYDYSTNKLKLGSSFFSFGLSCSTAVSSEAWAKLRAEPLILPGDVHNSL